MKKTLTYLVCALSALLLATSAFSAETSTNTVPATVSKVAEVENVWVISLGGVGQTATASETSTALGLDISIGRTGFLLLPVEAGVRQNVAWSTDDSGVFSTRVYSDWTLFSLKGNTKFDYFVGANAGLTYGDVQSFWTAAPETGFRWWLRKDVSVLGRAEFPFRLSDGAEFTETITYFLGFQVKF